MEAAPNQKKKSQSKLTRTQSSLVRCSSPTTTTRSSIHNLPSVNDVLEDSESEKKESNKKKKKRKRSNIITNPIIKPGSIRFGPVLGVLTVFSFILYFGFLTSPTSENVLVLLIFLAVTLFFVNRNKSLIKRTVSILKHSWDGNLKRLGFSSKGSEKPVQWFIGANNNNNNNKIKINYNKRREGVEFYSNGDFYEGEFNEGKCNGSGVYHYYVSGRYEGEWVDGRYDGYGIESWARGSRYKGHYRNGLRDGFGVYKFYSGDSYAGEWCNGQSHGVGVQACSDGSCYVGEFNYGVKHGRGCYHFRNGDRYAGEYFGDKIHGFGVYHFTNGHCYEGAWHEGRRQGYGVYTFRNGERRCGEWDAGNLKHSLPPLNDAILRAVQAARKTAENAINLPRKDDQVNKAVIAANRAATAARVAAVKAVQNQMGGRFCDIDV